MNWKYKALLQLAFSKVPYGERINYFFQRCVTRSLPTDDAKVPIIVSNAKEHIDVVRKYLERPLGEIVFYEFGAGWDLMIPLAFYSFGVECQILVDIRPLVMPTLVNNTIKQFLRLRHDFGFIRKPDRFLDRGHAFPTQLREYYGIEYRAPCDARHTGFKTSSIDCITSTNTLEHISTQDIQAILRECYRILRDDGLMSFRIDYQDHYSYFDSSISVYNFLRYSDKVWAFFSPVLHYQNRLRHQDYLKIFDEWGFKVIEEQRMDGIAADLKTIELLPRVKRFRGASFAELAVRNSLVVLRKVNTGNRIAFEEGLR
jgi:SAM-dependent methyltransferase